MRISFVLFDRSGYSAGPIVNAVRVLPALQKRGHDVVAFVFVQGLEAPNADRIARSGVTVFKTTITGYTEDGIEWLIRMVRDSRPDVFVANSYVPAWYAGRWIRKAGIPTVAVLRNDDSFHWEMVRRFVAGDPEWAVSGLVCVSRHLKEQVEQLGPKHTMLAVIPSGVPIPVFKARQERDGPLRLIYVGRLIQRQKRIREVVTALAEVLRQLPNASGTLIGQAYGGEAEKVEALIAAEGMTGRISCIGSVPSERIQEELARHHVIVLLSDYEGTPGALMDGMAAGLVPVCLDIRGGVRELVRNGETGILVKNRKESFVEAILRLDRDADLRGKLSTNARALIAEEYDLKRSTDEWEAFCQKLQEKRTKEIRATLPLIYGLPSPCVEFGKGDKRRPAALRWYGILKRMVQGDR